MIFQRDYMKQIVTEHFSERIDYFFSHKLIANKYFQALLRIEKKNDTLKVAELIRFGLFFAAFASFF